MREDVVYSLLCVLWRVVRLALPRLWARIKQYFAFSARTYRKVKRKAQSSNMPVIIYDDGERQRFLEVIGKAKYYGLPCAVWFGLYVLAPAFMLAIICIAVVKLGGYVVLGFIIVCMFLSWLAEKGEECIWHTKQVLEQYRLNVRYEGFDTFTELGELSPTKKLNAATEISATIRQKHNGVVIVSLRILKAGEVIKEGLAKLAVQIQVVLNRRLQQGLSPNFPFYSYDTAAADDRDRVYTLTVDSVKEAGVELEISVIVADNQRAVEYVRSKRTPPPPNPGQGNDKDF